METRRYGVKRVGCGLRRGKYIRDIYYIGYVGLEMQILAAVNIFRYFTGRNA